jgi:surface carbohydrate biosynthesis protein (TIGR04326 family)
MARASAERVVLIYDAPPRGGDASRLTRVDTPIVVELFPLTSRWSATAAWIAALEGAAGVAGVEVAPVAARLDEEAVRLRRTLTRWSTQLGRAAIDGVSLRRRLLIPGANLSGWWLTPLAERNPLVSRFIGRLGQAAIVDRRLSEGGRVAIALGEPTLCRAVDAIARARGCVVQHVGRRFGRAGLIERASLAAEPAKALAEAARIALRAAAARLYLGRYRPPAEGTSVLVTYFPAFDAGAARTGEFRDRYVGAVRDLVRQRGEAAAWLLLPQPIDGATFRDALRHARRLSRHEPMATWHQLLTPRTFGRGLARWARQAALYRRFRRDIEAAAVSFFAPRGAAPVLAAALRKGFLGARSLQAFLMHAAFERAMAPPGRVARVIYCAEFQPWETALCAAARNGRAVTIGFQHTTVPPNLYNYTRDPLEVDEPPEAGGMPLPAVLAANGERPAGWLRAAGVPNVRVVEAVRHAAMRQRPARADQPPRHGVLLIGSIDPAETGAMLELAAAARALVPDTAYILRPHPLRSADPVDGWLCTTEPVHSLLRRAAVAIVPSSSVAIEALALGCPVVQPIFPGVIATGPLDAGEGWHRSASTPEELANAVREAMRSSPPAAEQLIESMWHLGDSRLPRWSEVLDRP